MVPEGKDGVCGAWGAEVTDCGSFTNATESTASFSVVGSAGTVVAE